MKLFSVIYNIIFWFIAHLFLIYIIVNSEWIRDYESFVLDLFLFLTLMSFFMTLKDELLFFIKYNKKK